MNESKFMNSKTRQTPIHELPIQISDSQALEYCYKDDLIFSTQFVTLSSV